MLVKPLFSNLFTDVWPEITPTAAQYCELNVQYWAEMSGTFNHDAEAVGMCSNKRGFQYICSHGFHLNREHPVLGL